MSIIKKVIEKIIIVITMIWLAVWSLWIIIGSIMFDVYLHFINADKDLMILNGFSNTLKKISEHLKNYKANEENTINE